MMHALGSNEAMLAMNYVRKHRSVKLLVNYLSDDPNEHYLFVYECDK